MPDALLDIIGVVPVQLVFAYALTKMLNIRRLSLFWVLELVFVLLISCLLYTSPSPRDA